MATEDREPIERVAVVAPPRPSGESVGEEIKKRGRLVRDAPKSERARARLWTSIDSGRAHIIARYADVAAALYRETGREAIRRLFASAVPGQSFKQGRTVRLDHTGGHDDDDSGPFDIGALTGGLITTPGQIRAVLDGLSNTDQWTESLFRVSQWTVNESLGYWDLNAISIKSILSLDEQRIWNRVREVVGSVNHGQEAGIEAVIIDALASGATVEDTAIALGRQTDGLTTVEAIRLARTEVTIHWNGATNTAMGQLGVLQKQWLSSRDDKVRPTHVEPAGGPQTVPVGEDFLIGTSRGQHPGAMDQYKENVNCRCAMIPVLEDMIR